MATFNQQTEMQKLIETIARMDLPYDPEASMDRIDNIKADLDDERLCSDASALYDLIEQARTILKGTRK